MVMVCAAITIGALATQFVISQQLASQADDDLRSILENARQVPPPPLREFVSLSPYQVASPYRLIEVGGTEHANSTFIADELGLEVHLHLHTCRPRITGSNRTGEINLVDGSGEDHCTSGGMMSIVDPHRGDEFEIHFKLIGAPGGTLMWNARQLVSPRTAEETWLESLGSLRDGLPLNDPPLLPQTVRSANGVVHTHSAAPPHTPLMSGDETEMRRLLQFRSAFRGFYENPDDSHAQQVARLLIDTLLESPTQHEMSRQWVEEIGEAG